MKQIQHGRYVTIHLCALFFFLLLILEPSTIAASSGPQVSDTNDMGSWDLGAPIELSVNAEGDGPLSYQWQSYKRSSEEWIDCDYAGSTTNKMSMIATEDLQKALFRCVVTDANGLTATSGWTEITVYPWIGTGPKSVLTQADTKVYFVTTQIEDEGICSRRWQYRKDDNSVWVNFEQGEITDAYDSSKLSLVATSELAGYQFRCALTTPHNVDVYSDPATLSLYNHINKQPNDVVIIVGEVAKINISASGKNSSLIQYQWQSRKDATSSWTNSGQNGSKTDTLLVSSNAGLHGWQFRCIVTFDNGEREISDIVTLSVIPKITSQPKDTTVTVGDKAQFSVSATGKAPFQYQWQSRKNSSSEWVNSGQSGAKTSTLSVSSSAGLHGWQFRCVITDGNGQKAFSNAATMSLVPKIAAQPKNVSVTAGSTARFSVEANGMATLKYQWQSRKDATSSWANSGQSGAKTATLSVAAAAGIDGWQFRCVVTDEYGQKSYSEAATLSIVLNITSNPADMSVTSGTSAKFTVGATGKAPLSYQWQSRKDANSSWANSGQSGAKTATLSVAASGGLDGWQFRCVVTDGYGKKAYSNPATLSINLNITSQPENKSAVAGSTAKFAVGATGKATLQYQWQSRKNSTSEWVNSGQSGARTSTLSVTTSAGLDGYQFRCIITDGKGQKVYSNTATLTIVLNITSQPKDLNSLIGTTSKFAVSVTGKAPLTYQWQSRKDSSSSWANSRKSGAKTATLSVTSSAGLNGYQFRCVITDGNGKKVYTNPATLVVQVPINQTNFPNTNFRNWVSSCLDTNSDGVLSGDELSVEKIDVSATPINNLKGIEFFKALEELSCTACGLTSMNVSGNPALRYLACNENQLSTLDVSKNTLLEDLYCDINNLSTLDVSNNLELTGLDCSGNHLSSLDVSKNTKLLSIWFSVNHISSIDLSKNTALFLLSCSYNNLTTLNVRNNPDLYLLYCWDNKLTTLDVTQQTKLMYLDCDKNSISALNVRYNTELVELCCDYNVSVIGLARNAKLVHKHS